MAGVWSRSGASERLVTAALLHLAARASLSAVGRIRAFNLWA